MEHPNTQPDTLSPKQMIFVTGLLGTMIALAFAEFGTITAVQFQSVAISGVVLSLTGILYPDTNPENEQGDDR